MRIIVASKNKSKLKEIKSILKGLDVKIVSLENLKKKFRIIENGETFCENAAKKAIPVSEKYKNDYVLGEDSGLEADYLNGAPGIFSKRYSGPSGNSKNNNQKLLKQLEGIPSKERGANFCCCLVLAKNGKAIKVFEGKLFGRISCREAGSEGFGYDPVFYLPKYKKTVAQLPSKEKNKISHRAKAFKKLKWFLKENFKS